MMQIARRGMLVLALFAAAPMAAHADDPKQEVARAYAAWDATFNAVGAGKAPLDALADHYLPRAQLLPDEADGYWGPRGVKEYFGAWLPNSGLRHVLAVENSGSDGSMVFGTAKWQVLNPEGKVVFTGHATHIFERQRDGSLKLRVHTFNKK